MHRYLDQLKQGQPVLLENVPILDPVLSRSIITKGSIAYLKVGEKEVQYDPKFKLFLQTKLSKPHYRPEIHAQTTMVNFMVTEDGQQLLATVVNMEKYFLFHFYFVDVT